MLTPGRYAGAEAQEDDGEPFEAKLDAAIDANLANLGFPLEDKQ